MLLVCYTLLNSQNISMKNSEKRLVTAYQDTSGVAIKAAELAQKKQQQLDHGEFCPQWKRDNLKQSNIFKIRTFFLNLKLQIIRLAQNTLELRANSLKQLFYICICEKQIYQFILPKGSFCQFVDRKVVDLTSKYYLLAGYTSQVSIFFLT